MTHQPGVYMPLRALFLVSQMQKAFFSWHGSYVNGKISINVPVQLPCSTAYPI